MTSIFFTSDHHFGSETIAHKRGFDSAAAMDTALCAMWNKNIRPEDRVWVVGDIATSSPTYALSVLKELPGVKHLVLGNHDRAHPMHRDSHVWQARYLNVFASVQAFARRKIAGQSVLLSHFPYWTDHTDPARHMQYRLRDYGDWLIHGHTHSEYRYTSPTEMHVGVDAWNLEPVPFSEVESWVDRQYQAMIDGYSKVTV